MLNVNHTGNICVIVIGVNQLLWKLVDRLGEKVEKKPYTINLFDSWIIQSRDDDGDDDEEQEKKKRNNNTHTLTHTHTKLDNVEQQ